MTTPIALSDVRRSGAVGKSTSVNSQILWTLDSPFVADFGRGHRFDWNLDAVHVDSLSLFSGEYPVFVVSPTEQTTSVTDLILALQSLTAIIMLKRIPIRRPMWTDVWTTFFGLLCLASFLGAVAHGIQMTTSFQTAIWVIIYLALGLMMALFTVTAVTMTWNHELSRRCVPFCMALAIGFFAITQFWSDSFLLFVVYEAISMIVALTLYTACFWFRRERGSEFLAAGVVVGIAAAIFDVQTSMQVTMIWTFDNHGIFHVVQMLSLLLITIGIQMSHRSILVPDV